jgi:hypothetical protein
MDPIEGAVAPDTGAESAAPDTQPVETGAELSTQQIEGDPGYEQRVPESDRPKMKPNEHPRDFMARVRAEREAAAKKTEGEKKAEPAKEPVKEEPKEPGKEEVKEPAKEEPKTEETTDEKSPAEEELELIGAVPTTQLAEAFKKNPALEAELEKAGIDKNALFASSRLAAQATEFKQMFGDVETAKFAQTQAEAFANIEDKFTQINDVGTVREFLNEILPMSYVLDAEGKPVVDGKTGLPQHDGSVFRFLDLVVDEQLDFYEKQLQGKDDEESQSRLAALQIFKAWRKGESAYTSEDEPADIKAKREALNAEKENLHRQQRENEETRFKTQEDQILSDSEKQINGQIENVLKLSDLPEKLHKSAVRDIREQLFEQMSKSRLYTSYRDQLSRRGITADAAKLRVAHNVNTARNFVTKIAEGVLRDTYGAHLQARQQERKTKIDTQVAASRSEVKGATAAAAPAQAKTNAEIVAEVRAQYRKEHNGEEPDSKTVLQLARQARSGKA